MEWRGRRLVFCAALILAGIGAPAATAALSSIGTNSDEQSSVICSPMSVRVGDPSTITSPVGNPKPMDDGDSRDDDDPDDEAAAPSDLAVVVTPPDRRLQYRSPADQLRASLHADEILRPPQPGVA